MDVKFLVVTAISLALGVYVFYQVIDSIPITSTNNETLQRIKQLFGNGFNLAAIVGIVFGAAWIMRMLNVF